MTRTLITLSAVASTIALAAGCSSMYETTQARNPDGTAIGTTVPYATSSQSPEAVQSQAVQYGTVRNISQLDTARRTSGGGAILGAVIGGALGNQVGSGTGRVAATAAGAVGGAVVGNKIEEARAGSAESYYQVDVRLDNGDLRSFDYYDLNGLRVGDRVRIDNGQLQRW
jgi:outer membrane lipoprotein SlyB